MGIAVANGLILVEMELQIVFSIYIYFFGWHAGIPGPEIEPEPQH